MAKYKHYIGVTETADPGIHWLSIKKLRTSNIIITKHLENPEFRSWLIDNKSKIILHHTVTGWGGTDIEPGVPGVNESLGYLEDLIYEGFSPSQIVLRIDPIIPTELGFKLFFKVLENATLLPKDLHRIRVSVMDCYIHTKRRLESKGIKLDMYHGFQADDWVFGKVNDIISYFKYSYPELEFESCAEKLLTECEQIGCVSEKDLKILGLPNWCEGSSHQRKTCLCPDNKIQLLGSYFNKLPKCKSKCAYCYLK